MLTSWRLYVVCVTLAISLHRGNGQSSKGCPPQEASVPIVSLGSSGFAQCSHSNLPKVLEGLRSVGQYLQEPIDELILENNHLPSLPGKTFFPLRVMRLMLRYNGLERVSAGWLSGLETSLMELFIVEPELRSLPEDSLDRMNALEAITIQSNLMKRLPRFSALPKLRYLQIESLSLVEMSSRHFRALPALEKLHVVGSPRLARLEGGILQDLPSLTLVNISFCGISWIHPRAITHLPALTELWLVGNKITDAAIVGRSIRDLPALEILRLDYNYMDKLSEAAFVDLPSLKKLYISNNRITELHHGAFHRVPKLRMLDLNKNSVRSVHPESFLQHSGSGLEELWLVENDISHVAELRSLLDALPRLIFLDMSFNNLEAIPFGALRGHPTLERLHLDYNKIHLVEREAFMAMPALRELRLKNNSLSDILNGPLWNLPALKGLDLSGNYYRRIEPRLLANLPSLRKVDLSGNEITNVDPASFLGTPSLEHVNISHNALSALHPATFRHLLGLYELDLSNNKLLEFVPGLPRGIENLHISRNQITTLPQLPSPDLDLPALRLLDINSNGIQRISSGALRSVPQLKKLYIGKNAIQQLEDGSLDGLSRLEVLDLHDNRIIQVHPNALKETTELRELRLGDNRLNVVRPEVFHFLSHLKKLDISKNQLTEISPGTLENTRDIQIIDASHNSLMVLPPSLHGMKHLRSLELTNNRLKTVNPDILSSLTSLAELRLTQNLVQELRRGAFDNLLHLKTVFLDENELEIIEPHAFHSLPSLRTLKLNKNKLRDIPNHAFNNLPSLQIIELQENRLKNIANNAFFEVPHLLMLNLSSNQLPGLDEAGLRSMRSLEMLDLSNNKLSRVAGGSLEKMEWLVELRLDGNQICTVYGSPFNGMPRLRVLSIKNNKMMSFPEHSVQKLRGNLAVLDINGNPLACSCSMLWFRAWLQESSLMGPKCNDGILLRDMRLSRQDCAQESRQAEPVAPGCEAELLSAPGAYGTSQVFSQWMDLKDNVSTSGNNKLAPSPEESDYFYDEYVDYPYNETLMASSLLANTNSTRNETITFKPDTETQKSSHYIVGDTPTIYAAASKNKTKSAHNPTIPKVVSSSPSSSGFTFFGVPLPNFNLNLNNLWGRGNGRMSEHQRLPDQQIAERKTAIVNNPPPPPSVLNHRFPPTMPEIQTGGFIPLLPGTGGFKPIPNPHLKPIGTVEIEKVNISESSWPVPENFTPATITRVSYPTKPQQTADNLKSESSLGHPIPTPSTPTIPTSPTNKKEPDTVLNLNKTRLQTTIEVEQPAVIEIIPSMVTNTETSTNKAEKNKKPSTASTIELQKETKNVTNGSESNTEFVTFVPQFEQTANSDRFEDIFKEFVDNVSVPAIVTSSERSKQIQANAFKMTTEKSITSTTVITSKTTATTEHASSPISTLLAPQSPHYRPQGRPIITRVQSPHVSGSAPLLADLEISEDDQPSHLSKKETKDVQITGVATTQKIDTRNQDMSWYYVNYNKTNLEPYIGPGGTFPRSDSSNVCVLENFTIFLGIIVHLCILFAH
ncbi:hypothetical protein ILUMI_01254 [Ignelater luminosus]|uniref:Uncharacterized protein n=1 Tax=Ignelater luminosus TaxID=2038154 RepID=A0A8K0DK19_IGNLU|nr:hypothetical protein ILUMI_01254 [Ignelater luminosus]